MNQEVFKEQIERLKEVYDTRGASAYPEARVKVLFGAIKHMPDHWVETTVNDFIGDSRQPPLVGDFKRKVLEYEERKPEIFSLPSGPRPEASHTECRDCGGGGYATREDANGYRFVMLCHCSSGRTKPKIALGPTNQEGKREEIVIANFHENPVSRGP